MAATSAHHASVLLRTTSSSSSMHLAATLAAATGSSSSRIQPPQSRPRCVSTNAVSRAAERTEPPASTQLSPLQSPREYLVQELAKRDHASYLAHQFYPKHLQTHFAAIRTFNVETAALKDTVSNELLGRMRMGWWRDAVQGAYQNRPAKHPVVLALRDAFQDPAVRDNAAGGLMLDHFLRIIEVREADLADDFQVPSLDSLEAYAESTSSRLHYLSLNLLGVRSDAADELFSHLGKVAGLSLAISSIPFHSHPPPHMRNSITKGSRKLVLPREFVLQHNVVEEDVFRNGPNAHGFRDAVFAVATRANDYLITARKIIKDEFGGRVPTAVVPPLVGLVPARSYLERLEKADFNPYDASLQSGKHWRLPWDMWRTSRKRNI
ncbi:phytoene/squalene synthetase [Moesziomyces antarcticus T-34]|uniref:Phytoene/squalene synthetase n=1 Tax=Pseudozyma antarctica (strain T-34) TaxID=1151754 RepID=M9MC57_PSEA3|nr:phytoene/squalene synthetase [Moesziomyces antarcticus T-34]